MWNIVNILLMHLNVKHYSACNLNSIMGYKNYNENTSELK